jgi:hypothetical protein
MVNDKKSIQGKFCKALDSNLIQFKNFEKGKERKIVQEHKTVSQTKTKMEK